LDQQRKGNEEFFVRFVNLLLNDVTYLLDESITKLQKIHNLEEDLERILEHFRKADSPIDNFTLSPDDKQTMVEEQQTKTKELEELEGQTKSLTQLSKATLDLMNIFTKAVGEAFTMPEIVQRLADMVDYNLETLVGPKQKNLKVKDPLKYKFDPRGLLNQLVSVYLNLGGSQGFVEAIARDGRSYKPSNFASAARILSTRNLKNPAEIKALEKLAENIALAKKLDDQADEDLGDIPDEFTDPIMATLMEDPVVLPMSKQTVDRSTIRSHLLSDPTDPFNRQPMTIDDVISNTELKEKIEAWKAERRAAAKQKLVDQMNATEADYSEDKLDTTTTEDNPEDKMDTSE
jgi:ubiquitin conjugation factor E4 B